MAPNRPSISLTIAMADGATRVVERTTVDPVIVGSGASANVKLEGVDVSSLHCMLKADADGRITVLDLGSDEGTLRDGQELTGETMLADGDEIQVGGARITIHFLSSSTASREPPALASTAPSGPPPQPKASKASAVPENHMAFTKPPAVPSSSRTERERTVSGFAHPKHASTARRTMASTNGTAALLSPSLGVDEQPNDKGHVDVTLLWDKTVIGVERLRDAGAITIGPAPASTFHINDTAIPAPLFPLVTLSQKGAVAQVGPQMQATVDGKPVGAGTIMLELGQECRIRVGALEFVVQYSRRYKAIDMGFFQTLDFFYSKIFALALILQLGLAIAFLLTPTLPNLDDEDLFKNQNNFSKLILTMQEKKKEKKEQSSKKAALHKDDAGVFGKKDKPKEDKVASKKGAPIVDKDKREEDRKIAMDALAALGLKGPEGAVSNVFGPGGLGTGINNALGGLKGASMGDAGGAGGLGSRGTGAGGGGNALGIGGLGSGTGRGSAGNGDVDLGGRGKGMTRIVPGKVTYEGGLTREEIQRVISRVQSQIKYCYEKELTKDPNLEGKLVASWTISGTGDVVASSAAQNTFSGGSAQPVEQCVMRIIQRLKFPNPKGGGQVFVSYPWVFSASGT